MRYTALIVVMASAIVGLAVDGPAPADAAVQTTCPAEAARTRDNVVRFLTSSNFASSRQQYGMTGVDPSHLVLLNDAQNGTVCQKLRNTVQPQPGRFPLATSYYYAYGFYFVSTTWIVPEGRIWTGYSPLVILRSDLTYVDTFGI